MTEKEREEIRQRQAAIAREQQLRDAPHPRCPNVDKQMMEARRRCRENGAVVWERSRLF